MINYSKISCGIKTHTTCSSCKDPLILDDQESTVTNVSDKVGSDEITEVSLQSNVGTLLANRVPTFDCNETSVISWPNLQLPLLLTLLCLPKD